MPKLIQCYFYMDNDICTGPQPLTPTHTTTETATHTATHTDTHTDTHTVTHTVTQTVTHTVSHTVTHIASTAPLVILKCLFPVCQVIHHPIQKLIRLNDT